MDELERLSLFTVFFTLFFSLFLSYPLPNVPNVSSLQSECFNAPILFWLLSHKNTQILAIIIFCYNYFFETHE